MKEKTLVACNCGRHCRCGDTCRCDGCACTTVANRFDAIGTSTRVRVLAAAKKPLSVGSIAQQTGIEQTAVSHALRRLTESGFVTATRRGKQKIYTQTQLAQQALALIEPRLAGRGNT